MKEYIEMKLKEKKKFIVPYLTFGFPTIKEFKEIIVRLSEIVDIIEIGVPFSDPLADGATIQKASNVALHNGVTLPMILDVMSDLKKEIQSHLILMSYLNPCYRYGLDTLFKDMRKAGFEAVIFPDLPYGEWGQLKALAQQDGIDIIHLLSPTTAPSRAKEIMDHSSPFTYVVTLKGVTGARTELPDYLTDWLKSLKKLSTTPLFLGFGISRPAHVKKLAPYADGFIVGSRLIQMIFDNRTDEINNFINSMK